MRQLFFIISICLLDFCILSAQQNNTIELKNGWKFTLGDNLKYSDPQFDDSAWNDIDVNKQWELQGYENSDGFGWYRIKVLIPSSLKKNTILNDSLKFSMGKIDDFDQTFLNGQLLGVNGQLAGEDTKVDDSFTKRDRRLSRLLRRYVIPVDDKRIHWDKKNVIAVRVFDKGGKGGIYSGDLEVGMAKLSEYISSDFHESLFKKMEIKYLKHFH